jgi:hypothetical protein
MLRGKNVTPVWWWVDFEPGQWLVLRYQTPSQPKARQVAYPASSWPTHSIGLIKSRAQLTLPNTQQHLHDSGESDAVVPLLQYV